MLADPTPPPDGDDKEIQAQHIASRARLTPEEQAVGSDDPQEQARVILEESEERTEHPDADASSQSRRSTSEEATDPPDDGSV